MAEQKATNIVWHQGAVTREDRERLNGHRGCTVWLTGLSGSGKSTIAVELEKRLWERGARSYILDGDNIRHGLNKNLGFSPTDRTENIRRIGEVAKLFTEAGIVALTAFISPYRADRDQVRAIMPGDFTRLKIDGSIWMTDTPAEIADLLGVDLAMAEYGENGTMLIVGLGLGLVLQRAIVHRHISRIDVVEREPRVIEAVGAYYATLARKYGCDLRIYQADIHQWKRPVNAWWDLGWFDIWADIDMADMREVKLLRDRFRRHLGWFGAWAQSERIQQNRRLRTGKWAY